MRKTWSWIRGTKRRTAAAAAVAVLAMGGSALAFYLLSVQGTGTGTTTLGTSTGSEDVSAGVQVTLPSGLTPGSFGMASAEFKNTTSSPVTITSVTPGAFSSSTAGCDPSWFRVSGAQTESLPVTVPAGATTSGLWTARINFDDPGVDQSACEGGDLELAVSVAGTSH